MDHYIDLHLRPDPEFAPDTLMNALYAKLHGALVRHGRGNIGISFPGVREAAEQLGDHLRLHGSIDSLNALAESEWLAGMRDHVRVGSILQVPIGAKHRVVRRMQAKSNPERLRRRQMRRHGYSCEEATKRIPDSAEERLRLPALQLKSASTDQSFLLFIAHGPLMADALPGNFSGYGLSPTSTIPWF